MRAVVQRVSKASVSVDGETVSSIGKGLLVLVGAGKGDGDGDAALLAGKCAKLRVFGDEAGRMNLSLAETGGEALVVSQFTLFGDVRKGNRPGFDQAMEPVEAKRLCDAFTGELRKLGVRVREGVFRAHMLVSIENDGPVTILMDSKKLF